MQGKFFWYDLMTVDIAAAKRFYGDVIGWGSQAVDAPAGHDYTLFTLDGHGIAGLMAISEEMKSGGMRPCWMGYIFVDDVDQTAARIVQEGGTIHRPPTDVPDIIRFAVVADPQGAVFLIAKPMPAAARPDLPPGTPGTVGWHELFAVEGQSAFAFYEKLFGWTKGDAMDMGPSGIYQLVKMGGEWPAGGMMTKPAHIPAPYWGFYFNVAALDAAAARVTKGGGQILNGPMEVPGGQWVANCMDPQGAVFSIVAMAR